jgi:hypothetical protein
MAAFCPVTICASLHFLKLSLHFPFKQRNSRPTRVRSRKWQAGLRVDEGAAAVDPVDQVVAPYEIGFHLPMIML